MIKIKSVLLGEQLDVDAELLVPEKAFQAINIIHQMLVP